MFEFLVSERNGRVIGFNFKNHVCFYYFFPFIGVVKIHQKFFVECFMGWKLDTSWTLNKEKFKIFYGFEKIKKKVQIIRFN